METEISNQNKNNTNFGGQGKLRKFFLPGVCLLVGALVGFLIGYMKSIPTSTVKPGYISHPIPTITNSDPRLMLDPIEILKSPVFTEWGGSVEGSVVKKDANSFVIEQNGRQVVVYLQQSLTGFYKDNTPQATPVKIGYSDLRIGDKVRGGVTIARRSLDDMPEHHVFANVFTVLPNVQINK